MEKIDMKSPAKRKAVDILNNEGLNYLWSYLMVEELIRHGVDYFCIAPGSRSSPLAVSIADHPKAKLITHFDERGLAFHALGYSSATGKPGVILTTSGTAVANLFPAIVEASKKKVPLIILTADRPVELRQTGAHQTINQVNIFGEYVRFFFDLPAPTFDIQPNFVLTTVDQAMARSKGELKGPVHLNCQFREPLTPLKTQHIPKSYLQKILAWEHSSEPFTLYTQSSIQSVATEFKTVAEKINAIKNGLMVVGKLANEKERETVLKLSEKLNWPIFADGVSGLRLGNSHKNVIHYFDQVLLSEKIKSRFKVDGILHFGGRITSKRFYEFLNAQNLKDYIMVLNHPLRNDPFHNVTVRVQDSAGHFCTEILKQVESRKSNAILPMLRSFNQNIHRLIDQTLIQDKRLSEVFVARTITRLIPKQHNLFLSNSLPIREIDMYGSTEGENGTIGSNRGASGIDGIIASAIGFANGTGKPTTLLIGDLAFLHDLNSLAMLNQTKAPVHIVVLNNQGGGIFNFLPVTHEKNIFERIFALSHHLTFENAAKMFNLTYENPDTKKSFESVYQTGCRSKTSSLIEIQTDRSHNLTLSQLIQQKIFSQIT